MNWRPEHVERPSALQWIRYVYTGSVPSKNSSWVLYDATCPTWLLRHAVRYLVLVAPVIAAVVLFLPVDLAGRISAAFAAGASVLIGFMAFATESIERRVEKAGYPYGLAGHLREQRAIEAQRAVVARGRERREVRRVGRVN